MFSKYSVGVIIRGQINTMRHYGKKDLDRIEVFLIFIFPLVSPVIQFFLGLRLSETTVGTIVSAASIFAGLLLNLLVLLYSILGAAGSEKVAPGSVETLKERELIEQTFCNISFSIVICAALVISALVTLTRQGWWVQPAEALVYYLGLQLFFLVAQILKRFHRLLEQRMSIKIAKQHAEAEDVWSEKT